MQISRILLVSCAAACATTLAVRGNDTAAQIKAREALRDKMQQSPPDATIATSPAAPAAPVPRADSEAISKAREALHQQLQSPSPAPAPAPAPRPAPAPAPAPVAAAPAPAPARVVPAVVADAPAPPVATPVQHADPDAIAKARDAVRQRIGESPSTPPPAPAVAPAPVAPAVVATPAPARMTPPPAQPKIVPPSAPAPGAPAPAESDSIAKAREALRQQIAGESEVGPKADPETIAKARESVRQRMQAMSYAEPTSRAGNTGGSNFVPLEGPPLPISSEKHDRLNDLLQRYKSDQLTPEQYQAERAKILAGP